MDRAPELEALQRGGESAVADRTVRGKQFLAFALMAIFGVVAIYMVFASSSKAPRDMLESENPLIPRRSRHPASCATLRRRRHHRRQSTIS